MAADDTPTKGRRQKITLERDPSRWLDAGAAPLALQRSALAHGQGMLADPGRRLILACRVVDEPFPRD